VIGGAIVGAGAGDLISEMALAIEMGAERSISARPSSASDDEGIGRMEQSCMRACAPTLPPSNGDERTSSSRQSPGGDQVRGGGRVIGVAPGPRLISSSTSLAG